MAPMWLPCGYLVATWWLPGGSYLRSLLGVHILDIWGVFHHLQPSMNQTAISSTNSKPPTLLP